jgi:four helix bundle protein
MKIEDLNIYTMSLDLSNQTWKEVIKWDIFSKNTIGKQLVRAADSITANISEGFGRYHYKEEKQFLYYARGSLFETKTFIEIAHSRSLINDDSYKSMLQQLDILGRKLNSFINAIGQNNKVV